MDSIHASEARGGGSRRGRKWLLLTGVVLVCGLVLSSWGGLTLRSVERDDIRASFDTTAATVSDSLSALVRRDLDFVAALRGVMTMSPRLTPGQFDQWYATLQGTQRQAGSVGTAVVASVPAGELTAFERRRDSDPVFRARMGKWLRPIPRGHERRYCVLWGGGQAVPLTSLTAQLAQEDWCLPNSETGILESGLLQTAADTGQAVVLPLALPGLSSTFIEEPFYRRGADVDTVAQRRAAIRGWLVSSFSMPAVIKQAIGGNPGLSVQLDHSNPGQSAMPVATAGTTRAGTELTWTNGFSLDGRWTVVVRGRPAVAGLSPGEQGALIAGGGAIVTLLLSVLLLVLTRSRERALAIAAEKTGQLRHQALHDALTGLPNRMLALDRADQMLARARRAHVPMAALYVDIDGFKHVNDTFGHAAGDEFLRIVATRLQTVIRESDTAARLSGDEFVVLLDSSTLGAGPHLVAERLLEVLRDPYDMHGAIGRQLALTASIGVARGMYGTAEQVLADADVALYVAKTTGKDRYVVFESGMQTAAQDRLMLEMDLSEALEREQLYLVYQPTFDLQSERAIGAEALLRWRHPQRGVVYPDQFVPLAEDSGMIVPIGRWVLERACAQAAEWSAAGHAVGISVNVSGRQLDRDELIDDVRAALVRSGLAPSALTLEITESRLMRDPAATSSRLIRLKQLGVRVAIDDFGTGHSSLAYLREFPVDALKIDRSFIQGIGSSASSAALIQTLVRLGKTLNLETLAEGIEARDQLRALQRWHCDHGQGFLFAPALEVEEFAQFLDAQHAVGAVVAG